MCFPGIPEEQRKEQRQVAETQPSSDADNINLSCSLSDEEKPTIGVVFAFYPILFKPNENPNNESEFNAIKKRQFDDNYLLADSRQRVIVAVRLVNLDNWDGSVANLVTATASEHKNDGVLTVKLSNSKAGSFSYNNQTGDKVDIPLSEISTGINENLYFTTSDQIALTSITGIISNSSCLINQRVNTQPNHEWQASITVGSRIINNGNIGYDVLRLQWYLRMFGYLKNLDGNNDVCDGIYGSRTQRGITRLQRRSLGPYRVSRTTGQPDDAAENDRFTGNFNGICEENTVSEVRRWFDRGWAVPLGRFQISNITGGSLREDVAIDWNNIVTDAAAVNVTLSPYGDTLRPLRWINSAGASHYSFHYAGRAIDINQGIQGSHRVRNTIGGRTYWTLYIKVDAQYANQNHIVEFTKNDNNQTITCWQWSGGREYQIPEGHYLNLTNLIQASGRFERISAHTNYTTSYNGQEWWHFQYTIEKQRTFQDEVELIDSTYNEQLLRNRGWNTDAKLDQIPG